MNAVTDLLGYYEATLATTYYNVRCYATARELAAKLREIGIDAIVSSPAGNTWQVRITPHDNYSGIPQDSTR